MLHSASAPEDTRQKPLMQQVLAREPHAYIKHKFNLIVARGLANMWGAPPYSGAYLEVDIDRVTEKRKCLLVVGFGC